MDAKLVKVYYSLLGRDFIRVAWEIIWFASNYFLILPNCLFRDTTVLGQGRKILRLLPQLPWD